LNKQKMVLHNMINAVWLLVLLFSYATHRQATYQIFVSPQGSDFYTGLSPNHNNGIDGPVLTIQRAKELAKGYMSYNNKNGIQEIYRPFFVNILPGEYILDSPLSFGPEDSGESNPVVYRRFAGDKDDGSPAVITSCVPIPKTSWNPVQGSPNLVRTKVNTGDFYFHSFFVNGERRTRARSPELLYNTSVANYGFYYSNNDLKSFKNLEDVNVVLFHSWTASRHWISSLDENTKFVNLTSNTRNNIADFEGIGKKAYYVENAYELLDEPGEWYFDRKSGEITYFLRAGEVIETTCYPTSQNLISLKGDPSHQNPVKNIQFEDLTFSHTDWWFETKTEMLDYQAAAYLKYSTIMLEDATNIQFNKIHVTGTGAYAIDLVNSCSNVVVRDSLITDLGAGGIRIGTMFTSKTPNSDNLVIGCTITNGGNVFPEGIGILVQRAHKNNIISNKIDRMRYTGISVGWSWGYTQEDGAYGNQIEGNDISNIGMNYLSDLGGIYTLGCSKGTKLIRNKINGTSSRFPMYNWGIYNDEGTSDMLVTLNTVYNTVGAGFFTHYGANNVIARNLFSGSKAVNGAIAFARMEEHKTFTFTENIIQHCSQGDLIHQNFNWLDTKGNIKDHMLFEKNTYEICKGANVNIALVMKGYESIDWTKWTTELGEDAGSVFKYVN